MAKYEYKSFGWDALAKTADKMPDAVELPRFAAYLSNLAYEGWRLVQVFSSGAYSTYWVAVFEREVQSQR